LRAKCAAMQPGWVLPRRTRCESRRSRKRAEHHSGIDARQRAKFPAATTRAAATPRPCGTLHGLHPTGLSHVLVYRLRPVPRIHRRPAALVSRGTLQSAAAHAAPRHPGGQPDRRLPGRSGGGVVRRHAGPCPRIGGSS